MNKSKKRWMSGILTAGMAVGMLSGNGPAVSAADGAEADTSEHVVLNVYCIGDEGGIYAEDHIDAINELLTEKINAEINPIMVSWGDYTTKLPMVWASGEAYDLTYTSNWTNYYLEARKGAFMDITELFPKYAPNTYAEYEERGRLDTTKVDGKLYMVPNDHMEYTSFMYNYREDLRKKYDCPEIVDMETLKTYMQTIADNEPGMTAYGNNGSEEYRFQMFLNEQDWSRPIESNAFGAFVYDLNDPSKIFDVTETPEYAEFLKETREFYEKGYWSQSVMAETTQSIEMFEAGMTAVYMGNEANSNKVYQNIKVNHPDWEIGIFSSDYADSEYLELITPSNNGMAVGAHSKNPERALMFIELMYQDQELFNTVMYGMEGVTYEKDEETMTRWVPEGVSAADIAMKNIGMGFNTDKFFLTSKDNSPLVIDMMGKFAEKALEPGLGGFALNQDSVSAELAALQTVYNEYKMPLEKGVVDPEEGLEQLREAMKKAGSERVLEEIQTQVDAYLEGLN